ncbi:MULTISPECIES: hypothetical protein [Pectobacterium]|uniref:hypothetical protein n=1 Tax=Pectobacterium TaxID=122277 RepID=UPI001CD24A9D|nr:MULTISPECIES: hypothetical protein [Pectobacterium]UPY96265.1 hypothetical protein MYB54_06035 [Pectobacterium sp. 21LCBS03]
MCDITTALVVGSLATSGISAFSGYQSGRENAKVAEQNAELMRTAANDTMNRGNADADRVRNRYRQMAGTQAATIAAGGGDLSAGTSLDILGDTAATGELDAMTTLNNADREAYGYRMQAANYDAQAQQSRKQGAMGAFTTLLTAPLQAYGAYQLAGGGGAVGNLFKTNSAFTSVSGNINSFYGG